MPHASLGSQKAVALPLASNSLKSNEQQKSVFRGEHKLKQFALAGGAVLIMLGAGTSAAVNAEVILTHFPSWSPK